jgi:cytochrome c
MMNRAVLFSAIAATTLLGATLASAQDVENGADIFKRCRACHDIGEKAKNKVGPILNGIVGRKAGTIEGYKYSDANLKAGSDGWVWTEEKMMAYLLNPRAAMPGNKMAFAGLKDELDRKDLIAYLKQFPK